MAAKQLQRRFQSLLFSKQYHHHFRPSSLLEEPSSKYYSSAKTILNQYELHLRNIQTHAVETVKNNEDNSISISSENVNPSVKYKAISNLKMSARHDMAMIFTCKVCETRSVKTVCRESYETGIVLARCDGCNNTHLIADRLGWFGEPGSIEELLASRGEEVRKGSVDTMSLTLEELAGIKS